MRWLGKMPWLCLGIAAEVGLGGQGRGGGSFGEQGLKAGEVGPVRAAGEAFRSLSPGTPAPASASHRCLRAMGRAAWA